MAGGSNAMRLNPVRWAVKRFLNKYVLMNPTGGTKRLRYLVDI